MKDEIIAGLQNAVARGQSLDQAAQSFKNAGYNSNEVDEAKNYLAGNMGQILPSAPTRPQMNSGENQQSWQNQQGAIMPRQMNSQNQGMAQQQMNSQNQAPVPPPEDMQISKLPSTKTGKPSTGGKTALIIIVILLLVIFIGALGYLVYYLAT